MKNNRKNIRGYFKQSFKVLKERSLRYLTVKKGFITKHFTHILEYNAKIEYNETIPIFPNKRQAFRNVAHPTHPNPISLL